MTITRCGSRLNLISEMRSQFWGLEDFMNTTETAVTNAVNLSFFLVNLSYRLLRDCHQDNSDFSLLDLKACFRGYKYVEEVWKLLTAFARPNFLGTDLGQSC